MNPDILGRVPLVIGVVGDGEFEPSDREKLRESVAAVFRGLKQRYPSTPMLLLASTSRPADRLVAQVALGFGAGLILAEGTASDRVDGPETDAAPEEVREFRRHQLGTMTMRGRSANGAASECDATPYARTADYISSHSHILIALWDGAQSQSRGDTARIVRLKLEGCPRDDFSDSRDTTTLRHLLEPMDAGPVYHVLTPRCGASTLGSEAGCVTCYNQWTEPAGPCDDSATHAVFERIFENFDRFNRAIILGEASDVWKKRRRVSREELLPAENMADVDSELQGIGQAYATADTMALQFRDATRGTVRVLYALALLAGILFELYAHLPREAFHEFPVQPLTITMYIATLLTAYGVWYIWIRKRSAQEQYQDYRALAEGLRVLFYWRLSGMKQAVTDHYLLKQRSELDWIRRAIRQWETPLMSECGQTDASPGPTAKARAELTLKHWIDAQRTFYDSRVLRHEMKRKQHECREHRLLLTSSCMALVAFLLEVFHFSEWDTHTGELIHSGLVMLIAVPLLLAALNHFIAEQNLSWHEGTQYKRLLGFYEASADSLRNSLEHDEIEAYQSLLLQIGHEALEENGDWVLDHRERPVHVPQAS